MATHGEPVVQQAPLLHCLRLLISLEEQSANSKLAAGSQRFVKDLTEPFTCLDTKPSDFCKVTNPACTKPCVASTNFTNIGFDKIDAIVEFSHVAGIGLENPLSQATAYMHVNDATDLPTLDLVSNFRGSFSFQNPADGGNATSILGDVILAKKKFRLLLLGLPVSVQLKYDDGSAITPANSAYLCGVATRAAQGIFRTAGGSEAASNLISANCTLVSEMFTCFTRNLSCTYLSNFYNISQDRRNFFQATQYQGTFEFSDRVGFVPFYTQQILANATAVTRSGVCVKGTCEQRGPSYQCIAGQCVETQAQIHFAYGTGLEFNYNLKRFEVADASKPSFVESSWSSNTLRIRTFMTTSPLYQAMQVVMGVVLTAMGIGGTLLVQKAARKRFKAE
ncbi:hypothetical protein BC829DRAFT_440046 [Chytridium lagenaria]|nr:hypothetical protein BC829DRAFT_440046 [Chytridium lagenaria]